MAAREIADKRALTMGVSGSARLNRLWILIQSGICGPRFEAVLYVLETALEVGNVGLYGPGILVLDKGSCEEPGYVLHFIGPHSQSG